VTAQFVSGSLNRAFLTRMSRRVVLASRRTTKCDDTKFSCNATDTTAITVANPYGMEAAHKLLFDPCDMRDEELNISCRTNSSGCDVACDILDTSAEDFGSPTLPLQPRKLSFNANCDADDNQLPVNNNDIPLSYVTGYNLFSFFITIYQIV